MPMEKKCYRDNLEQINQYFGEPNPKNGIQVAPQLLPIRAVASFLGVDYRTLLCDKTLEKKRVGNRTVISVVALARWLS